MLKKLTVASAIVGLGIAAAPASALTVSQILAAIGNDPYRLEDNDVERLNRDLNGNGLLDVGDTLQSVIEIEKIINERTGQEFIVGSGVNDSLTGTSEIEVKAKVPATGGNFTFTFGPVGGATGSMISFYSQAADPLNVTNCGASTAACITAAQTGANILNLGFNGRPGENWTATAPDNPDLRPIPTSTDVGGFNFGVTRLSSTIDAWVLNQPWIGSGSLQGCTTSGGLIGSCVGGGFTATSDFQLSPRAGAVPEPTALSLLGLGLLAAVGFGRRRMH